MSKNNLIKIFVLIFSIFLIFSPIYSNDKYSFENTEKLKPLINWMNYSNEAFNKAVLEDKPIFLLLTAPSWCYWCQVYESEDYLFNTQVVDIINSKFIPIYVDADKRQDLTRQFLEGGWPSTTILTPDKTRLYGYSGPRPVVNMIQNLNGASLYVKENSFSNEIKYTYKKENQRDLNLNSYINIESFYIDNSYRSADLVYGGFGDNQKFPQARTLNYFLEYYKKTKEKKYLDFVKLTLINQYTNESEIETNYNIFDPIEGGFHRYGVDRDWTPPHYEKMLYDNARLLKTYFNLMNIEKDNKVAKEVFEKTNDYMIKNYLHKNGGFYANTDVAGEDKYYFKKNRDGGARVEKTIFTDWNSEAIITYLYLYDVTKNETYKNIAEKSLNFFLENMLSDDKGVYHYYDTYKNEKGLTGNLFDNSYFLLALVEGYEKTQNEIYLDTAKKIANYSIENLYDYNSGGFFERNSKDLELFSYGDNIVLDKPSEENSIMSYALAKLYIMTNDINYLYTSAYTFTNKIQNSGGLDRFYYFALTYDFYKENNFQKLFNENKLEFEKIKKEKLENFWVSNLLLQTDIKTPKFIEVDDGIEKLNAPILILIIVAFLAGFISFISPCSLPILPGYIALNLTNSKKNSFSNVLSFFFGLILVFTLLGLSSTFIGIFLKKHIEAFSIISGILILFFGIYILLGKGIRGFQVKQKNIKSKIISSFLFGLSFGISWTPCVGPILVSILILASSQNSIFLGGFLLFIYGVGLSIPLILVSFYLRKNKNSKVYKILKGKMIKIKIKKFKFEIHTTNLIAGLIFILLGYLILSGDLYSLNKYILDTSFQKWIFGLENFLLEKIK